jgi:hypothetical protein
LNNEYENRITAFLDILGFSSLIKESESKTEILNKIFTSLKFLKTLESPLEWNINNIEIEEDAQKKGINSFILKDKINVTCFSDSIAVSVNLDKIQINEAASTLIANLSSIGAYLLTEGILIRGAITKGNLIHTDNGIVLGQALINAYNKEKKISKYPRIILSKELLRKLNYPLTKKINRYPYHQYLFRFSDGCVGFHQLIFFQVIQSWIEMTENMLKQKLLKAKDVIINGLDTYFDNPEVFEKYNWLKNQYNKLIILGENVKEPIRELNEGISGNNIHYKYTDDFYRMRKHKN